MKKILMGYFIAMILLFSTGCGNNNSTETTSKNDDRTGTLICTKNETDSDDYSINETITIKYEENIVKNVTSSTIMQTDPEYLDMTLSLSSALSEQFNDIDGMNYKISKKDDSHIETLVEVDYDKIDIDKLNELISSFNDGQETNSDSFINNIKNKNLTLDDYKSQNLNDYICK